MIDWSVAGTKTLNVSRRKWPRTVVLLFRPDIELSNHPTNWAGDKYEGVCFLFCLSGYRGVACFSNVFQVSDSNGTGEGESRQVSKGTHPLHKITHRLSFASCESIPCIYFPNSKASESSSALTLSQAGASSAGIRSCNVTKRSVGHLHITSKVRSYQVK